jgi:pimeloyl-ACP methyl ester carboxylesterase
VILLHGWPYDIHSYVDVAPLLASVGLPGHRAVSARLRTTRFLSSDSVRNGQQSALAADIVALMDVLRLRRR